MLFVDIIFLEHIKSEYTCNLNYKISVDVQCSHDHAPGNYYNILRVGRGGEGSFGDRVFMMTKDKESRGVLNLAFLKETGQNRVQNECTDGEWNTYSLIQRQMLNDTSRVRLSVQIDGVEGGSYEMDTSAANQLANKKLKVYLSDPFTPFSATSFNVRNFFLEQYAAPTTTTSTTTITTTTTTTTTTSASTTTSSSTTISRFIGDQPMNPVKSRILRHVFKGSETGQRCLRTKRLQVVLI